MQLSRRKQSAVRAIDTNIVVRFLTADDEKQAKAARKVIKEGDVFVATTVVLEIEWVLRAGLNQGRITKAAKNKIIIANEE